MATISQQLNELINQKSQLAANLNTKGVAATSNEKFNTLVPKVLEIEAGIDTSDATAISSDIKEGKTAYVNGVKITGDAYTRGTVDAVVDGKKHYLKTGFYEGINIPEDADLLPENIRSGVEIYGTTGTLESLDTSDATATAAEIRQGYTAYVNGEKITGTIPDYDAHTYIPTTEDQHFEPGCYITGLQTIKGDANLVSDNIKAGVEIFGVSGNPNVVDTTVDEANTASTSNMLKDTIAFVNGTKIIGSCESMADTVITPSTENQAIAGPKILQGNKTIQILGDENLISGNIKKGITIFNVEGSLESESGIDTSDATAAPNDILSGKTAYVNGEKITGTIESLDATTYTPSTENQIISQGKYLSGDQTILGDSNLIPENIKAGVSIFNVEGTLSSGSSGHNEQILLNCRDMTSSTEVLNTYQDSIMVSNDGAFANFNNIGDYVYNQVSTGYLQDLAGINFRAETTPAGFYFKNPITLTSPYYLLNIIFCVSTWINPTIKFHLVAGTDESEVQSNIASGTYVFSQDIILANVRNKTFDLMRLDGISTGTYYIFFEIDTAPGGNEAIMNYISLIKF